MWYLDTHRLVYSDIFQESICNLFLSHTTSIWRSASCVYRTAASSYSSIIIQQQTISYWWFISKGDITTGIGESYAAKYFLIYWLCLFYSRFRCWDQRKIGAPKIWLFRQSTERAATPPWMDSYAEVRNSYPCKDKYSLIGDLACYTEDTDCGSAAGSTTRRAISTRRYRSLVWNSIDYGTDHSSNQTRQT